MPLIAKPHSWPKVRATLDAALNSERGIAVEYPDWTTAESVRKSAYRIRDAIRAQSKKLYPDPEDPRHGISQYDGLMFFIRSTLARDKIQVIFHDRMEKPEFLSDLAAGYPRDDKLETKLPRDVVCSLRLPHPEDPSAWLVVRNAPSFSEAWRIAREPFPAILVIENAYNEQLEKIEYL